MSQKTIALQLRTLAADPDSQSLLLKESSCLTGLVALLNADNEEDVLILSLQALQFLATPPSHHAVLVNQSGLVLALTLLTDKPSITIKTLAQNVINNLENYINGANSNSGTPSTRRTPIHSRAGSRGNTRPTTPSAGRENGSGVLGAFAPRYLNHVMFHITSATGPLDKLAQGEVEKVLVSLKGVISVTYSAAAGKDKQPCFTLYTSHRPAILAPLVTKAISDLRGGYTATMLNKDGSKESGADKENQENEVPKASPAYLSKAGPSYLKGATKAPAAASSSTTPGYLSAASLTNTQTGSRALTTHTTATSACDSAQGLAARYKATATKKTPAAMEAPKKGILSSVTSFFW
jgi:hypothetical protein